MGEWVCAGRAPPLCPAAPAQLHKATCPLPNVNAVAPRQDPGLSENKCEGPAAAPPHHLTQCCWHWGPATRLWGAATACRTGVSPKGVPSQLKRSNKEPSRRTDQPTTSHPRPATSDRFPLSKAEMSGGLAPAVACTHTSQRSCTCTAWPSPTSAYVYAVQQCSQPSNLLGRQWLATAPTSQEPKLCTHPQIATRGSQAMARLGSDPAGTFQNITRRASQPGLSATRGDTGRLAVRQGRSPYRLPAPCLTPQSPHTAVGHGHSIQSAKSHTSASASKQVGCMCSDGSHSTAANHVGVRLAGADIPNRSQHLLSKQCPP